MPGLASKQNDAAEIFARYADPRDHYSFQTYDHWYGHDGPLIPSDVLMANLMSLRLGWQEVIPLFAAGDGPHQRLRVALGRALDDLSRSDRFESYESVDALEAAVESLAAANVAAEAVPGWTDVTVSKVLHRRRPHIVPIIDSRVRKFYGARKPSAVRAALWEDLRQNQQWLLAMVSTRTTPDGRPLSVLRLADILIWME